MDPFTASGAVKESIPKNELRTPSNGVRTPNSEVRRTKNEVRTPYSELRIPNRLEPSSPRDFPHRESGRSKVPSHPFTDSRFSVKGGVATIPERAGYHSVESESVQRD